MTGATHQPYLGTWDRDDVPQWERDLDSPSFIRRPRVLPLLESGEMEEDQESPGVSAVHWAPRPPRWTVEPPVRPGVYHVRPAGAEGYAFVKVEYDLYGELCYEPWGRTDIPAKRVPPAPHSGQTPVLEWGDRAIREPVTP